MDNAATSYPGPNAATPEPDCRTRAEFECIEDFIASDAFDEAVLRAGRRGVERAVARHRELGLDAVTKRD